jgi:thioredoxin 1
MVNLLSKKAWNKKEKMGLVELTDENFENEVLQSDLPAVIEFYSGKCGPCKELTPLCEKVSSDYEGKAKFAKCNFDLYPGIVSRYKVKWASTMVVVKQDRILGVFSGSRGTTSGQVIGSVKEDTLKRLIDSYLGRI